MSQETFVAITKLLETFGMAMDVIIPPFASKLEHKDFLLNILGALFAHFSLADGCSLEECINSDVMRSLERVLYR